MQALILVVHGDREGEAERVLSTLVSQMQARHPQWVIEGAQLLSSPSELHFPEVVRKLARRGLVELLIFPWFLFAGPHVRRDLPQLLNEVCVEYPALRWHMLEPFGTDPALLDLLEQRLHSSMSEL